MKSNRVALGLLVLVTGCPLDRPDPTVPINPWMETAVEIAMPEGVDSPSKAVGDNIGVTSTGTILVIYRSYETGIYLTRSTTDGATWEDPWLFEPDTLHGSDGTFASLAIGPDDSVHVVWRDEDAVYYSFSTDGLAWSSRVAVGDATTTSSYSPQLSVDPLGRAHFAWGNETNEVLEVFYRRFDPRSGFSGPSQILSFEDETGSAWPRFHVNSSEDVIAVTWRDGLSLLHSQIHVAVSVDGGKSWETQAVISEPSFEPDICVDSKGTLHLTYMKFLSKEGERGDYSEVFYRRSEDKGVSWLPEANIRTDHPTRLPHILHEPVSDTLYWIAKDESLEESAADRNPRILIRYSKDGGETWSEPELIGDHTDTYAEDEFNVGMQGFAVARDGSLKVNYQLILEDRRPFYFTRRLSPYDAQ